MSFPNVKKRKYGLSVLIIFTTFSYDIDHHRLAGRDEEVTASSAISARDTHKWYPLLFCHRAVNRMVDTVRRPSFHQSSGMTQHACPVVSPSSLGIHRVFVQLCHFACAKRPKKHMKTNNKHTSPRSRHRTCNTRPLVQRNDKRLPLDTSRLYFE